jgi:hypothetical protein
MRKAWVMALCLAAAACGPTAPAPSPAPAPAPAPAPPPPPPAAARDTPASAAARSYYATVQGQLLSQGLMRTDGGGTDTPWTDRMLAENFIRVALYDEYRTGEGGPVRDETASRLRRWEGPVRISLRFGPSVSDKRRAADTARVGSYLARLAAITGHPIGLDDTNPNFVVAVVSEDERRALGPAIAAFIPALSPSDVAGVTAMPRNTYCLVYAYSASGTAAYSRAFAVIRAEHPDLLRTSCFHEEIAQGLGLANDSRSARPSIFNDDEEFALLTAMDEQMLRILYDPALRPGMTEAEARPIVESLAASLTDGAS